VLASFLSPPAFNPQTGLMEQSLAVTNVAPTVLEGVRVVFPEQGEWVYNASGTNHGRPYVALMRTLDPGAGAVLLVEYFVPSRIPFADPEVEAWGVPVFRPAVPAGTGVTMGRPRLLPTGGLLLEFPAEPGRTYCIVYSDNVEFADAWPALPVVTAPADRVQWIDEGPPKTFRRPDRVPASFYRVIEVAE